jgi:Cu2+-exporting ATPase
MTVTSLHIEAMHCGACVAKIRQTIEQYAEVEDVRFNPVRKQVFVSHDDTLSFAAITYKLAKIGFEATVAGQGSKTNSDILKRLGIAGLALMQVMMVHIALYAGELQGMAVIYQRLLEYTALVFCIPVVTYAAVPFYRNGLSIIRHPSNQRLRIALNMDTPIALAILVAFLVSLYNTVSAYGQVYYDSVVMFTFLLLAARFVDQRLRLHLQPSTSISALPTTAMQIIGDQRREILSDEIQVGDQLWVAAGAAIPIDGQLLSARASLDETLLTGEAAMRHCVTNEYIYAGTLNGDASIHMQASALAADCKINKIEQLAEQALNQKHRILGLADRVAQIFIPTILVIAGTTFALWHFYQPEMALSAALGVLVVSCPCALSLSVPAAISAAITRLRRAGLLVKNSKALEQASLIQHIAFDKTGTLTDPNPQLTQTHALGPLSENTYLRYAQGLQAHSSHPIANAFLTDKVIAAEGVVISSRGVSGLIDGNRVCIGDAEYCAVKATTLNSENKFIYMSVNGELAAMFELCLTLRGDAHSTMQTLHQAGLKTQIISGDSFHHCEKVARILHMDFSARIQPEKKYQTLLDMQEQAKSTMFVGDGFNDLAALAQADISVATLETTDLVKSKADVILMTPRLSALVDLLHIGKRCRRILRQNLAWSLLYNLIAIPSAAFGLMSPWMAAAGMSASSIIVLLNSSRLLREPTGENLWKF